MIQDILALAEFIQKSKSDFSTLTAMFDWEARRVAGDSEIEVERVEADHPTVWFYRIRPRDGYVFIYMPLIPGVYLDYGTPLSTANQDAKVFRFVSHPLATFQSGGAKNVKVDFFVLGYRPSTLLTQLSYRAS